MTESLCVCVLFIDIRMNKEKLFHQRNREWFNLSKKNVSSGRANVAVFLSENEDKNSEAVKIDFAYNPSSTFVTISREARKVFCRSSDVPFEKRSNSDIFPFLGPVDFKCKGLSKADFISISKNFMAPPSLPELEFLIPLADVSQSIPQSGLFTAFTVPLEIPEYTEEVEVCVGSSELEEESFEVTDKSVDRVNKRKLEKDADLLRAAKVLEKFKSEENREYRRGYRERVEVEMKRQEGHRNKLRRRKSLQSVQTLELFSTPSLIGESGSETIVRKTVRAITATRVSREGRGLETIGIARQRVRVKVGRQRPKKSVGEKEMERLDWVERTLLRIGKEREEKNRY